MLSYKILPKIPFCKVIWKFEDRIFEATGELLRVVISKNNSQNVMYKKKLRKRSRMMNVLKLLKYIFRLKARLSENYVTPEKYHSTIIRSVAFTIFRLISRMLNNPKNKKSRTNPCVSYTTFSMIFHSSRIQRENVSFCLCFVHHEMERIHFM